MSYLAPGHSGQGWIRRDRICGARTARRRAKLDSRLISTMRKSTKLISLSILAWLGCQASPRCGDGYDVDPAARVGCRSPEVPGCAECCFGSGASCAVRSWSPGGIDVSHVTPWYNKGQTVSPCPSSCAPCARCNILDEKYLCSYLEKVPKCDYESVVIGPDPCQIPESCACICLEKDYYSRRCPPLIN